MNPDVKGPEELRAIATSIIDANRFMTLATADGGGKPWASPVWFAPDGNGEFLWVSSPEAQHSRNLAARPEVAIVIFDSHETGGWNAVYMSATAAELDDVDDAIVVFSRRSQEQGFGPWSRDDVLPPARHRLYRAVISEHFVLDPHDQRQPVRLT
jgi:nitroimidazol reductase NimA-like FMN-containing flavoprotein (pyridoxamine 5'-phosphate oxidase superfamily)